VKGPEQARWLNLDVCSCSLPEEKTPRGSSGGAVEERNTVVEVVDVVWWC
jgi:hypothetical protein